MLALDTETHLFGPGNMAPKLVCLTTSTGHIFNHNKAGDVLEAVLVSGAGPLVGHNIAYDMGVAMANYPHLVPLVFKAYDDDRIEDTGIRQKLIDIAEGRYRGYTKADGKVQKIGYSLKDLAARHLGLDLDKTSWRTGYAELDGTPIDQWPEGARRYAIDDAITTSRIWEVQENKRHWLADQHRQVRSALWLHLMSAWGIHTDPRRVRAFADATRREYGAAKRGLMQAGLVRPDRVLKSGARKGTVIEGARDTKAAAALVEVAFERLGREVPRTDKGAVRLDEATCLASGDPELAAYARLSSLKKTLAENIPVLEAGAVAPLHSRFEVLMETGRTSSSNPQLQNLPRTPGIRECFVPRPGTVFASADYSGLELRTVAQCNVSIFGKSHLAEVLNAGGDPHCMIAATVLGCTYDEAYARYKAGDEEADTARQIGKVGNFGFPGGLGIASMVDFAAKGYGVILTEDDARTLKEQWLATWPEFQQYFRRIGKICDEPEPVIEQLFSGRFRGGIIYTAACNTLFQGLGADAAKAAGWLIAKACYVDQGSVLYGSRIVNFIHDEFILEVPEDAGHDCAVELARLMCEGAAPWLPDVPPKAEPLLMRYWSKKAKPVFEGERLIPWE